MNQARITKMIVLGISVLSGPGLAWAWHGEGHERIAATAATWMPSQVPAFFRDGAATIAHCSRDPDLFKKPLGGEALNAAETPDHFLDMESLKGAALPGNRYAFIKWCLKNDVDPEKAGLLPYAVIEWTQRLTVAFVEYRRWPNDRNIQSKILVYAGILSHYSGDLCQPLHTTVDYDGRADNGGKSPHSGIHTKVDALIGKLPVNLRISPSEDVTPFDDLASAVTAELQASHALVDKTYELEASLPAGKQPLPADGPVAEFTRQRFQAASLFTARLFFTAWQDSAGVKVPAWHDRPHAKQAPASQSADRASR